MSRGYDPKCEELARYFLDDDSTDVTHTSMPMEKAIPSLAQAIQNAIERWFEDTK